jgi:hypothetical protein
MATTKRSKAGRAAGMRGKVSTRGRVPKAPQATSKPKTAKRAVTGTARGRVRSGATVAKAKPVVKTKPVAKAKIASPVKRHGAAPKRPSSKPAVGTANAELTALKNKFQRERSGLEKRLTEAVREIGLLRHHELRAMQFERQLGERDAIISRLQTQLAELERRPAEPVYVREVQQTLALGSVAQDVEEFEGEHIPDDGDLVSDDE